MKTGTLSVRRNTLALHIAIAMIIFAAIFLILSADSFAAAAPAARGEIDADGGAYLRKSSSTTSEKLALLDDGTDLIIYRGIYKKKTSIARKNVWYYVKADGKKGYVRADCIDNIQYSMVAGKVTSKVNCRRGPGTKMKKTGTLKKGAKVTVYLDTRPVSSTRGSSKIWYKIYHNGRISYVCSKHIKITGTIIPASTVTPDDSQVSGIVSAVTGAFNKLSDAHFERFLTKQGFPEDYKDDLRELHDRHPSWVFTSYRTGINWSDALKKQTVKGVSLVYKSYPKTYRNGSKQIEPGWYNASSKVVAYYMDPRNFLNEDRIYMFEDLSYKKEYQTAAVVNKIIGKTKLPTYGFKANIFISAGAKNNISPVFLAARVVQETGGNSVSVNGSKSGGKVVYNPFNIGAYGSDPAKRGLAYAKKMGWTTPAAAVNGGAEYLARGYINKKQNTVYFQRFNVANGLANAGTHQYMTNIMAPYSESHITKTSYTQLGITHGALCFQIPVYTGMPKQTRLP